MLVHVPGKLGERLAGPEIRAAQFAQALSASCRVTLAAEQAAESEYAGIPVVPSSRERLLRESARHDAVLSACLPPYLLALKALRGFVAICDQYDPHDMEIATKRDGRERARELRSRAAIQALQLRYADVVLCAAERQRAELSNALGALGGVTHADPVVIPFGIPDPPPATGNRPLREHFPQIAESDTLVLWWGSVWRWLDAETAVRAFAQMADSRSDIKLVITAGRPARDGAERHYNAAGEVRALADRLGVLGRTVLFFDEWIPYERRHDYLRDADIGLTLHRHAEEARLAARARYMDYLSAELPCVLGRGDEMAEEFGAAGFATLLESPAPDELADTLRALADRPDALAAARAAGCSLACRHQWSAIGAKLRQVVAEAGSPRPADPASLPALLGGTGMFYARRALDRVLVPAGRRLPASAVRTAGS